MAKTETVSSPAQTVRPLLVTQQMTEFGAVLDDPEASSTLGQSADITWTPGWSQLRIQRDYEVLEVWQGKRKRADVTSLPGNVRLTKRCNTQGAPDQVKQMKAGQAGYRPVTKEDVGQPWFTALPAGATILADGTIAKGDCVYSFCPPQTAARNVKRKQDLTKSRLMTASDKAETQGISFESRAMAPLDEVPASRVKVQ